MKSLFILTVLFFFSACNTKDDLDSFYSVDFSDLNKQITYGKSKQELWVKTPALIVNKFFGPTYNSEGHGKYILEQNEKDGFLTIIITDEGILDDSVYGEKTVIDFTYSHDSIWTIKNIKRGVKCASGRGGHDNYYSGQACP